MKVVFCREHSSPRVSYALKSAQLFCILNLLCFLFLFPASLHASGGSGPGTPPFANSLAVQNWNLELEPGAGSGASVSVTALPDLIQHCGANAVGADVNITGSMLSVWANTQSCLPADASCALAVIDVFDAMGNLNSSWSVEVDGGEVIVVLIED